MAARQIFLSFTFSLSLLKLLSIESVTPSNHLILCHPFLLLLSIFPSIRVFPKELALPIRWPKDWSFSVSPSNEYSGLICFRIDWFDPAIQGTLKSLLQHHSWKPPKIVRFPLIRLTLSLPSISIAPICKIVFLLCMCIYYYILSSCGSKINHL